ncbi:hypothetical protein KSP39_PZI005255 [Platanthera zijinensis]|uniref:Uncharacterized protein n=1 Tax=Platanthera zijinensis TaxID=2320716 RepID=A0AAP0BU32_9ASPA
MSRPLCFPPTTPHPIYPAEHHRIPRIYPAKASRILLQPPQALFNAILENVCDHLSAGISTMNIAREGMLVKLLDDLPFIYSRKTLEDKMSGYFSMLVDTI